MTVPLCDLQDHVAQCEFSGGTSRNPIKAVRMTSKVADVLAASPSKLHGNVSERLTGHLVKAMADGNKLEVKTSSRGQPLVFHRLTKTRVASDQASAETVRRRSLEISQLQQDLSGGTTEATRVQEVAGLKKIAPGRAR